MKHNWLIHWEGMTSKGQFHREMIVIQKEEFNVEKYRKELMREYGLNQCVVKKFSDLGEVKPEFLALLESDSSDPQMDIEVEAKKKKVIRRTPKAEA
jgi:ssDNA-specific exonuclease RecJ